MDDDMAPLQPMHSASLLRMIIETLLALHIRVTYHLDQAANRTATVFQHMLVTLARHILRACSISVEGIMLLDRNQLGSHYIREMSTTTGTVLHTRTRRGRDRSERLPYRGSESNAIELTMSTVIACSNTTMRIK